LCKLENVIVGPTVTAVSSLKNEDDKLLIIFYN